MFKDVAFAIDVRLSFKYYVILSISFSTNFLLLALITLSYETQILHLTDSYLWLDNRGVQLCTNSCFQLIHYFYSPGYNKTLKSWSAILVLPCYIHCSSLLSFILFFFTELQHLFPFFFLSTMLSPLILYNFPSSNPLPNSQIPKIISARSSLSYPLLTLHWAWLFWYLLLQHKYFDIFV